MFESVQHILATILVGYLSITQSVATFIDSSFEYILSARDTSMQESGSALDHITALTEKYSGATQRILLENKDFQNAALIASTREEPLDTDVSHIPLDTLIKNALVNVFCQYKTDTYVRTTTGSGFIINPKGVILTNAHVAQFLLLEGIDDVIHDVECVIRTGDPAEPVYHAELLHISPTWIFENATLIDEEKPQGTGERDYALLYITRRIDNQPLPASFPFIPPNTDLLPRNTEGAEVVSAGYPAGKLLENGPKVPLHAESAENTIGTMYTFGSNYADIFSVSDSRIGEQGVSGGPVVMQNKQVIGLIVTKGSRAEGEHSLRALTLSYINRTIAEETGYSLLENMQGDVASRARVFKNAIEPFLSGLLKDELNVR